MAATQDLELEPDPLSSASHPQPQQRPQLHQPACSAVEPPQALEPAQHPPLSPALAMLVVVLARLPLHPLPSAPLHNRHLNQASAQRPLPRCLVVAAFPWAIQGHKAQQHQLHCSRPPSALAVPQLPAQQQRLQQLPQQRAFLLVGLARKADLGG